MGNRIRINYDDVAKAKDFFKEWSNELRKEDGGSIADRQDVVDLLAEFVRQQIRESLVVDGSTEQHGYGAFMAKRTRVNVVPKDKELWISIEGMTEAELPEHERRASKDNEGINLWALYESGAIGKTVGDEQTDRAFQKDVGSVLAIRKGAKFEPIHGRREGLMAQIFSQIRNEIKLMIPDLVLSDAKQRSLEAAGRALKKSRNSKSKQPAPTRMPAPTAVQYVNRLSNWQRRELSKAVKQEGEALARLGHVEVLKTRQVVVRGAGGRFVAHPVTKVVLQNKRS